MKLSELYLIAFLDIFRISRDNPIPRTINGMLPPPPPPPILLQVVPHSAPPQQSQSALYGPAESFPKQLKILSPVNPEKTCQYNFRLWRVRFTNPVLKEICSNLDHKNIDPKKLQ